MQTKRNNPQSKRSQGVDRHLLPRKVYHAPQALFDALEQCARDQGVHESEIQRRAVQKYLRDSGHFQPSVN